MVRYEVVDKNRYGNDDAHPCAKTLSRIQNPAFIGIMYTLYRKTLYWLGYQGSWLRMNERYEVKKIGIVKRSSDNPKIIIEEKYRPALLELENFSHVMVIWWGHKYEEYRESVDMQIFPPYAPDVLTGLFATRSPVRPNPILVSTCKVLGVDVEAGVLEVNQIDAFDETPVLDLKVYFPTEDRVKDVVVPDRFKEWGEWLPEEGIEPEYYG
jgi:tRNA-Thr(GGU) m(6)t(6)A37 methyltransferase TsaA